MTQNINFFSVKRQHYSRIIKKEAARERARARRIAASVKNLLSSSSPQQSSKIFENSRRFFLFTPTPSSTRYSFIYIHSQNLLLLPIRPHLSISLYLCVCAMAKQGRAKKQDKLGTGKVTPMQIAFIVDRYLSDNNYSTTLSSFRSEASDLLSRTHGKEVGVSCIALRPYLVVIASLVFFFFFLTLAT